MFKVKAVCNYEWVQKVAKQTEAEGSSNYASISITAMTLAMKLTYLTFSM